MTATQSSGRHFNPAEIVLDFQKCVKKCVMAKENRPDFYESKRFSLELVTGVEPATH